MGAVGDAVAPFCRKDGSSVRGRELKLGSGLNYPACAIQASRMESGWPEWPRPRPVVCRDLSPTLI